MTTLRRLLASLFITVFVWLLFTWPLPRHLFDGIPSSARNVEKGAVRAMIPGDHLQLLYHFWLGADVVQGQTPPGRDLYQFNAGDDKAALPVHHYLPFSLVYAAFARIGGRAFGWNMAGLTSLWLGFLFTWLLARRYTRDDPTAAVAALVSLLLPFRWSSLLGGSPTGYGVAWLPVYLLGLDLAIRDGRAGGGWLAGAALLGVRYTDIHTFFFAMSVTPFWCVLALVAREKLRPGVRRIARSLVPLVLLAVPAFVHVVLTTRRLRQTSLAAGPDPAHFAVFSPERRGLFAWQDLPGPGNQIYFGWLMAILLLAGALVLFVRLLRRVPDSGRPVAVLAVLAAGIAAAVMLALGTAGPLGGRAFALARRIIPFYARIRQPAKVFCLMPPFLTVAGAVCAGAVTAWIPSRRVKSVLLAALAALLIAEYKQTVQATVCLLDQDQGAYQAVAEDAAASGRIPRALAIPLWPGDSAWGSLYQHYASLYRIRMVNGYSYAVGTDYQENVYRRFAPANTGSLSDKLLDDLLSRGIDYLLLHENAFPEDVSPFPVSFTLARLLGHPRIQVLRQAEAVGAFRILPEPKSEPCPITPCRPAFPAVRWELEDHPASAGVALLNDASAGAGQYLRLETEDAAVTTPATTACDAPGLRVLVRARGRGKLDASLVSKGQTLSANSARVDSEDWTWVAIPFSLPGPAEVALKLACRRPPVDVDLALLVGGEWHPPKLGERIVFPAACFFHAGWTGPDGSSVVLTALRDPEAIVFYGPKLPLEAGAYDIELQFSSPAPAGTLLGRFNLRLNEQDDTGWVEVKAGERATTRFVQENNLPVFLAFLYLRNADMEIRGVTFKRVE